MSNSELVHYNPWWTNKKAIDSDPDILAWNTSNLKWDPRQEYVFNATDHIYSLRGSRQVGKTTLVKLDIKRVLKIVPKWNVLYYSFELGGTPQDVVDVLRDYLDRSQHIPDKRHFIYLDEISSILDWQRGIKKLKDQGRLKNCTVVVTGSHSMDIRQATELLPGRRGPPTNEALDKTFLPVKFSEFVSSRDKEIKKRFCDKALSSPKSRFSIIKKFTKGTKDDLLYDLSLFQRKLDVYLDEYLLTGGMPIAINNFLKTGFIEDSIYRIYFDAIMNNLSDAGKNISYVRKLIPSIIDSLTTPVSLRSLQQNSGIGSHHTVAPYLDALSDIFVLSSFYCYDSARNRPKYTKNMKIYFRDPFFMHALNAQHAQKDSFKHTMKLLDKPEYKSKVIEQVVADHCIRLAYSITRSKINFSSDLSVFYWRDKNDKEVDFLIRDDDSMLPVEVKYQNKIKSDDHHGIINFKKTAKIDRGIIVTKDDITIEKDTALIPVSMFLMLI